MMTDPMAAPQGRRRGTRLMRRAATRPTAWGAVQTCAAAMIFCAMLLNSVAAPALGDAAPAAPPPPPPPPPPSTAPESVERAIGAGKDFLFRTQKNGNWEEVPFPDAQAAPHMITGGQWGGQTALATYALLAAGEPHQQTNVRAAIEWLKKADI